MGAPPHNCILWVSSLRSAGMVHGDVKDILTLFKIINTNTILIIEKVHFLGVVTGEKY